jgi:hypothetical protein
MPDISIPDLPDDVIAAIDEKTDEQGLSRNDYLRRLVKDGPRRSKRKVTIEDLQRLSDLAQDLDNPEIMRKAWE